MKKNFIRTMFTYMIITMVLVAVVIFAFQIFMNQSSHHESAQEKLNSVEEKLQSNDEQITNLTENLGENNLAKTRAFVHMIELNPEIINNKDSLNAICKELMVNELHVIDANGIITHSTVDAYVGFDMASGEQSAAFLSILQDSSIEIVQEPQKNVVEGVVTQYIGVARKDAKGFVQVGIQPEILAEMLRGTSVDVVLSQFDYEEAGYIFAIDQETNQILAHTNSDLVGTDAALAGFPTDIGDKTRGTIKVDGKSVIYETREYDGMIIGTALPEFSYFKDAIGQTIAVTVSMLIINLILLFMINRYVEKNIVSGIINISNHMKEIEEGNFDIVIEERGNSEFIMLSTSINKTVQSIKENLENNKQLLVRQSEDVENNKQLFVQVKDVCEKLEAVSKTTLENSHEINKGTTEQEEAVINLKNIMTQLSEKLRDNAEMSSEISDTTSSAVKNLMDTREKMNLLTESMGEISETSTEIEKIIGQIDSIAQQTNMLSLNASIEAARAGEMGKGFAVVATQVGELAARSAQAAKESSGLIQNSIEAVARGKHITEQAVSSFGDMVSQIENASKDVEHISTMVSENVGLVEKAEEGIQNISQVVQLNIEIARKSEMTAEHMSGEADKLYHLVEV